MKRGKVLMTVLVVLAVLFASCSNGLSENAEGEGGAAAKAVKVGLSLNGVDESTQKTVAFKPMNNDFKCYVLATPLWDADENTIQNPYPGDINDVDQQTGLLVDILNNEVGYYSDGMSLGYFTPGTWRFDVYVYNVAAPSPVLVYTGTANPVYISPVQTSVDVDMDLYGGNAGSNGSIAIKIAVPSVGPNTQLYYSISPRPQSLGGNNPTSIALTTANTIVDQNGQTTADPNWSYFNTTLADIPSGNYTLTLDYKDNGTSIGGATLAFTVHKGDTLGVYGTIEEGQYQIAALTLKIPNFKFNISGTTPVLPHRVNTVEVTAAPAANLPQGLTATYAWYLNGGSTGGSGSTYNLSRENPGRFEVVAVATIKDGSQNVVGFGYGSKIFTVTAPANINFASQIANGQGQGQGPNVDKVTTGGSLVCTPTLPQGYSTVKWYVDGAEQPAASIDNENKFTLGANSDPTTESAHNNYIISCKAFNNNNELIGYGFKPVSVVAP